MTARASDTFFNLGRVCNQCGKVGWCDSVVASDIAT
jgi:hypothetical protein